MGIKLPDNAKILMAGQPFHGLWKAGSITLPNAATKTCPAPTGGACVLIKVPDQATVTRSEEEAAADTAAGLEWRNYGLLSGGRYGSVALPEFYGEGVVFFIDAAKKCWLMRVYTAPNLVNYMTVRLRRFGLIDGTINTAWSAAINVPLSSDFVTVVNSFLVPNRAFVVVSQNSTGRKFVIGYRAYKDGYLWCDAMAEITVSSTVDLEASDLGLTFSHTVIESQHRNSINQVSSETASGTVRHIKKWTYEEFPVGGGTPTGNTYDRTVSWENGYVISDDGPPTGGTGNWDVSSSVDIEKSSSIEVSGAWMETHKFYVWAGYHNDVLSLAEVKLVQSYEFSGAAATLDTGLWKTGPMAWDKTARFVFTYGETVVVDHSNVIESGAVNDSFIAEMSGNYGDAGPQCPYEYSIGSDDWARNPYWSVLDGQAIQFSNWTGRIISVDQGAWVSPVIRCLSRTWTVSGGGGTYSAFITDSVHAPSGASQSNSGASSTFDASWHPVTNQLAVDTENICWF